MTRRPLPQAWRAGAAALLALAALALSLPPLRVWIEQSMVWHMLVQMPLLMCAGWWAAAAWGQVAESRWNRFGLSAFMLAQVMTAYWMVPAAIDRAVVLPGVDATKIASLWLGGWALRSGFKHAPPAVQLFFAGYSLPMLVWLGLYLASTELRLCNAYSLQSQVRAGWGLVVLAAVLSAGWIVALVLGRSRDAGWSAQPQKR